MLSQTNKLSGKPSSSIKKLLFIDTNIWLDFYRIKNDASTKLLNHVDKIADRIIVTHQLEMEFKKNRQKVIAETNKGLKIESNIGLPGIFSDGQASATMQKHLKEADKRVKTLKKRLGKLLEDPAQHDPVYQVCQRVFHKTDSLVLTREMPERRTVRNRALRRFLHGCPPCKVNDTSYGDSINWEWMILCALRETAELVIVSRDADYGVTIDDQSYINDHLRHEFNERVSRKRKLLLYTSLSQALKHFDIPVSEQEEAAEKELLQTKPGISMEASEEIAYPPAKTTDA